MLRLILICLFVSLAWNPRILQANKTINFLERARSAFVEERFSAAIKNYKKHLRQFRKDGNAWTELAACFYFTGRPKKALKYLRRYRRLTKTKSVNYFYEGLALLYLGAEGKAQAALTNAARFTDDYGARATHELAVFFNNRKVRDKTFYWTSLYKKRYPRGRAIKIINKIDEAVRKGKFLPQLKGNKKVDPVNTLFKHSRFSLSEKPHYYFLQFGYDYTTGVQADPTPGGSIKKTQFDRHAAIVNSGVGVGPLQTPNATGWAGYNYKQNWFSNSERLNDFPTSFDELSYFPFRPDLLERAHQVYGELRYRFLKQFFTGAFGQYEIKRIGSNLIPGADQTEAEQVANTVSKTSLLIPNIGMNYLKNYQTLLYLYMRQEINQESPEFSNQSYCYFNCSEVLNSFGLSHRMAFPKYKLKINAELFQYEYIFNDRWQDYTRQGLILGGEYNFYRGLHLRAVAGIYRDSFELPNIKQGGCKSSANEQEEAPEDCPRTDQGSNYEIGIYWNYSQFERVSASLQLSENKNSDQPVFDKTENQFVVMVTMAFPSVNRVLRFVDRFGEKTFARKPE